MITLLSFFTFAEADGGSGMYTPWVPFPDNYDKADLWIDCKLFHSGQADVTLQSSTDGENPQTVSGPTSVSAAGVTVSNCTSNLARLVRLFLQESGGAGGTILVLTITLIPKQS